MEESFAFYRLKKLHREETGERIIIVISTSFDGLEMDHFPPARIGVGTLQASSSLFKPGMASASPTQ